MLLGKSRHIFIKLREVTQRHAIVQNLYIVSFCLAYLMPNIWASRTLFYYVVTPLALISIDFSLLRSVVRNPIFILSGIFMLLLTLTSLAAPDVNLKIVGNHLLQTLRTLLFLIITAELLRKDDAFLKTFVLFLSLAAAIAAVINIVTFYGGQSLGLSARMQGIPGVTMYYNPNVVAAVSMIPCVAGASLLIRGHLNPFEMCLLLVTTLILLLAIVLTQSRGSILATAGGVAIAAILAGSWRQRLMFVVSAMVALICVYVATPLADLMFNRPSLRLELWSYFLWMASERPWLGVGLTFDVSLGQMLNAHNIILSALVRGGIFAAVTLISLIVVCLYQSLQAWRRGALLVPVALMTSTILATAVDYEIIATSLGWQWLLFWLPVGMCLAVGPQASWQARSLDAARATIAPRPSQAG